MYDQSDPILSGLPNDIALSCLARVPLKYHSALKCVSRRWRDLVTSEEWHLHRQKHNLEEPLLYALCRNKAQNQVYCYLLDPNPQRRSWKLVPGVPSRCLRRKGMAFQTLGTKLYLLGGCGWFEDVTDDVFCYNALANAWTEVAPLPTPRCYFACEVVLGKIYTVGGLGSKPSDPCYGGVYDPLINSWTSHPGPYITDDIEDSVVMDGKMYIRCGTSTITSEATIVVYDLSNGTWQHGDTEMALGWLGPAVVVDSNLYVLDQSSGTRLMIWKKENREWVPLGRLSPLLTRPPCRLVAVGKNLYVIGKGLRTLVLDLSSIGNVEGVLVSSSISNSISDDDVLSCKSLSL